MRRVVRINLNTSYSKAEIFRLNLKSHGDHVSAFIKHSLTQGRARITPTVVTACETNLLTTAPWQDTHRGLFIIQIDIHILDMNFLYIQG